MGQYYREDKNMYDKAAEYYEYAANNCPKSDDKTMFCQVELVKYYIRTGDLAAGDRQYNKLINEFADNNNLASNVCFIGDTYLRAGETDLANLLYTSVLNTWPDNPQTIFAKAGFAKIDFYLGKDADANQVIDQILANDSDNTNIADSIYGIADYCWTAAMKEQVTDKAEVSRANEFFTYARNTWERIINDLTESSLVPDSYYFAGGCYRRMNQFDKAIEYYNALVDKYPDSEYGESAQFRVIQIYKNFIVTGEVDMTDSDTGKAVGAACERMIELYPDSSMTEIAKKWKNTYGEIFKANGGKTRSGQITSQETEGKEAQND